MSEYVLIKRDGQTWVEIVPKDVIAWRKERASASKLISGVSSGFRFRPENLQKAQE